MSYFIIVVAIILFLFPIFWMVLSSFKPSVEVLTIALPSRLTLDNYNEVLTNFPITTYLGNSLFLAIGSTLIAVAAGSLASYGLIRYRSRFGRFVLLLTLCMRTLPGVALAVPLFILYTQIRLTNTYTGLMLAHVAIQLPLVIWIMSGFLQDIPGELIDAGLVDGCNRFTVIFRIVLPLAAPGIAVSAIFAFLLSWNNFDLSLTLASRPNLLTMPVGMSQLNLLYGVRWDLLSAAVTMYIVPTILLALALQRYIVRGLTLGAVKG